MSSHPCAVFATGAIGNLSPTAAVQPIIIVEHDPGSGSKPPAPQVKVLRDGHLVMVSIDMQKRDRSSKCGSPELGSYHLGLGAVPDIGVRRGGPHIIERRR